MVKIGNHGYDIEKIRELQKEKAKERRKRRNLSHIDETEMVEPAKEELEEQFLNEYANTTWYHEPLIQIRERETEESPAKVQENPDLIAISEDKNRNNYIFVVELKKVLGKSKRSVHQALLYYWAAKNGVAVKAGSRNYEISGDELVYTTIGYLKAKHQYYSDFFDWLIQSLELGHEGIMYPFHVDLRD